MLRCALSFRRGNVALGRLLISFSMKPIAPLTSFSLAPVFPPVGQCDVMKRYFQCNDGRCLPRDQVCDISRDCPDGEDEDQDCGKILFGLIRRHVAAAEIINGPPVPGIESGGFRDMSNGEDSSVSYDSV